MAGTWATALAGQLEFYLEAHLAPRLVGLTDDEYWWEPTPGCWSLRRRDDGWWRFEGEARPGAGPLTTIAWRMTHVTIEVLESRYLAFFADDGPTQWAPGERILADGDLPATADDAVAALTDAYRRWHGAIAALDDDALLQPLGPKGVDFAEMPMTELVLHLNREVMHHGGEICLLRDLWAASDGGRRWTVGAER